MYYNYIKSSRYLKNTYRLPFTYHLILIPPYLCHGSFLIVCLVSLLHSPSRDVGVFFVFFHKIKGFLPTPLIMYWCSICYHFDLEKTYFYTRLKGLVSSFTMTPKSNKPSKGQDGFMVFN